MLQLGMKNHGYSTHQIALGLVAPVRRPCLFDGLRNDFYSAFTQPYRRAFRLDLASEAIIFASRPIRWNALVRDSIR